MSMRRLRVSQQAIDLIEEAAEDTRRNLVMSEEYKTISDFDRMMGALDGLPDVVHTKPTTIQVTKSLIGVAGAYIVQTFRQRDGKGKEAKTKDTIFLQVVTHEGTIRVALPNEVAETFHRHAEALGTKTRKKAAQRVAQERKDAGIEPAFLKKRRGDK